ncbi:unnamed protein product [Nippostrongylus brasiliensis]|uniref:Transposase n=1 Tax=Nippostrongylus brasiliensis TaxID=27835 RepID=A0A0N4YXW8_NIPBR|nr:unnamed protein product [Nippostrongylus brasiliensis]
MTLDTNEPQISTILLKYGSLETFSVFGKETIETSSKKLHLLRLLLPDAVHELRLCTQLWAQSINFQTYEGMVMCVRQALGAQRIWPEKIRIYRKMHGWNRAAWVTKNLNAVLHSEEYYRNEFPNKGRLIIYLEKPEISSCYPDCEKQSRMSPEQYRELIENAIDKKNDAYSGKH